MQKFVFENTNIQDLKFICPFIASDDRGHFMKSFEREIFQENGIDINVSEANESKSAKGVIRGLHFQYEHPQSKLVKVNYGDIFDVAVDLRKNSCTFGKWQGFYLSDKNRKMLFIPKGFAHGFLTLSDTAIVSYICDGKYMPEFDSGILWNDLDINIKWPIDNMNNIVLSEKDKRLQTFEQFRNK